MAGLELDTDSICAALLHDTVEDCSEKTNLKEVEKLFGADVALLVDGLTKLVAIPFEDKVLPDAYASRPIGGVSEDYVSYLGSYYFLQDPADMVIAADRDYVALSNQEGTIHSLRFVWAGLLRNAKRIEIAITDDITGEVIFETVDDDVRKSYGDGGSIYPANVEIEFDTMDYNLANNSQYTVTLTGYLDYNEGGIETNKKNVFSFPLTVDYFW